MWRSSPAGPVNEHDDARDSGDEALAAMQGREAAGLRRGRELGGRGPVGGIRPGTGKGGGGQPDLVVFDEVPCSSAPSGAHGEPATGQRGEVRERRTGRWNGRQGRERWHGPAGGGRRDELLLNPSGSSIGKAPVSGMGGSNAR